MSAVPPGDALRVDDGLEIPARELRVESARAGGPGGQNVNKVETKVILRFSVAESDALGEDRRRRLLARLGPRLTRSGELVIHASRHRERARNLEDARQRLAGILRAGLARPRRRKATRPTAASRRRRLEEKRRRGERKRERRGGEGA